MTRIVADVWGEARQLAIKLDRSFAERVLKADELHEAYDGNPLVISVPILGAFLRFRPDMIAFVKQRWDSSNGYTAESSGITVHVGQHEVKDRDGLSLEQIVASNVPEINYIRIVDWFRKLQSILFFIPELFGAEFPRLDLWGSMTYKSGTGGDVFVLPLVTHPARLHVMLKSWSATLVNGVKAMNQLVDRADTGRMHDEEV